MKINTNAVLSAVVGVVIATVIIRVADKQGLLPT